MDIKEIRLINLESLIGNGRKAAFAEKIGMSPSQLSQIRNSKYDRFVGYDLARSIETIFNKPHGWMDQLHNYPSLESQSLKVSEEQPIYDFNADILKDTGKVPLIDMVAAGDWTDVADPYSIGQASSWESCPVPHGENTFALVVNGESMLPKFENGDIIFCDPSKQTNNGDYVIAKLTDDNQATFKQLVIEDGSMMLKAINPNWHTTYIPINGNCHIVGKVIARLEKF